MQARPFWRPLVDLPEWKQPCFPRMQAAAGRLRVRSRLQRRPETTSFAGCARGRRHPLPQKIQKRGIETVAVLARGISWRVPSRLFAGWVVKRFWRILDGRIPAEYPTTIRAAGLSASHIVRTPSKRACALSRP